MPYGATVSPNGKNLYVITNGDPNGSPSYVGSGVVQLAIDQSTGALSQIGSKPLYVTTTNQPTRGTIPPDGNNLYVSVAGNGDVYNFSIDATDGSLTNQTNISFPGQATPYDIHASYDNAHVYVSCSSGSYGNLVRVYHRDTSNNGNLTEIQTVALSGAFSIRCSKDGTAVFAVSNTTSRVYWYARDNNPASGTYGQLTWVADTATPSDFPDRVTVSDDGLYVYVSSDSGSQFTGVFKKNTTTNALDSLAYPPQTTDNNGGPWSIALSTDSTNSSAYVAISDAMLIAQYDRHADGTLAAKTPGSVKMSNWSATPANNSGGGPYDVVVSPNSKFLFATANKSNTIDVFSVAPDPLLTFSGSATGSSTSAATLTLGVMLQGSATGSSSTNAVLTFASPGIKATDRVNISLTDQGYLVTLI